MGRTAWGEAGKRLFFIHAVLSVFRSASSEFQDEWDHLVISPDCALRHYCTALKSVFPSGPAQEHFTLHQRSPEP